MCIARRRHIALGGILMFTMSCAVPTTDDEDGDSESTEETGRVSQAVLRHDMGFLPHNTSRMVTGRSTGCRLRVMHGNFLGAAYAKVVWVTGNSGGASCSAQPRVVALRNGQIQVATGARTTGTTVSQAQINLASIIGSEFVVSDGFLEETLVFDGIP
jgi:hypothetical protein